MRTICRAPDRIRTDSNTRGYGNAKFAKRFRLFGGVVELARLACACAAPRRTEPCRKSSATAASSRSATTSDSPPARPARRRCIRPAAVPAFDGGDDFVWIGRPNERSRRLMVPARNQLMDRRDRAGETRRLRSAVDGYARCALLGHGAYSERDAVHCAAAPEDRSAE
jgi:hypothetical protein